MPAFLAQINESDVENPTKNHRTSKLYSTYPQPINYGHFSLHVFIKISKFPPCFFFLHGTLGARFHAVIT